MPTRTTSTQASRRALEAKSARTAALAEPVEFDESNDGEKPELTPQELSSAVLFNTDWTVETITAQTQNINFAPGFQRRDAWRVDKKSKFIESLILNLPVPPIILAEQKDARGKFLVIDGKQRLLSMMQFWGKQPMSPNNSFRLERLDVRDDLNGLDFESFSTLKKHSNDFSALQNQPIRTVVIRNWPTDEFLHLVFLRLNTGSVRLSAQELRQALLAGPFTKASDEYAADNKALQRLLHVDGPDPRMRDSEILGRHLAFVNFLPTYGGRLKTFIDSAFRRINADWPSAESKVRLQMAQFDLGLEALFQVFGVENVGRLPDSRQLNKTLLDPLLFYFADEAIRKSALKKAARLKQDMTEALNDRVLLDALRSDTAASANVVVRFNAVARALKAAGANPRTLKQRQDGALTMS